MAVLENRPSKTLGFLHVFSSENDFFNTLLTRSQFSRQSVELDGLWFLRF